MMNGALFSCYPLYSPLELPDPFQWGHDLVSHLPACASGYSVWVPNIAVQHGLCYQPLLVMCCLPPASQMLKGHSLLKKSVLPNSLFIQLRRPQFQNENVLRDCFKVLTKLKVGCTHSSVSQSIFHNGTQSGQTHLICPW